MSVTENEQPMTRRGRRLLEEQVSHAAAETSTLAPAFSVAPVLPVAPAFTLAPALPAAPVVPLSIPPAPVEPVALTATPPPHATTLTRRERRALEGQGATPLNTVAGGTSPPEPVPRDVELATLLHVAQNVPVAEVPMAQVPIAVPDPLPPVFGAPNATQAPDFSASRTVGSVSSATSSLILSHTPMIDMTSPLSNTGEVVVTGHVRLPSSLSERGGAPTRVEGHDQDEVLDAYVTGSIAATAKPIRASQAVSGKGDDTDIVLVRRARWGTATVVTGLIAGVLGLAALGLLVVAMLTDVVG